MGTNFNPTGLRTFAEMGFKPQFNISAPQSFPAQGPQIQPQFQPQLQPQMQPQLQPQFQAPGQNSMIQPASQNAYTAPVQNNQMPNVNLENTPKKDTVTIAGKEFKKKNVIFTGLGLAAMAAVAGILAFNGRTRQLPLPDEIKSTHNVAKGFINRAKGIIENAKIFRDEGNLTAQKAVALADEANAIAEKVHGKITEVIGIFTKSESDIKDSSIIRTILPDSENKRFIMTEYAQDGKTPIRTSYFNREKFLESIVEHLPDKKENIIVVAARGKVTSYEEGIQKLSHGGTKTDAILAFENGTVVKYKKGFETFDGGEKADFVLELDEGQAKTYMEAYEKIKGSATVEKIKRVLEFKKGTIASYKEDVKIEDQSIFKIKRKYNYEKDKYQEDYEGNYLEHVETRGRTAFLAGDNLKKYEERIVCEDDRPTSVQGMILYDNEGAPERFYDTIQVSEQGAHLAKRGVRYDNSGELISYVENIEAASGKTTTYTKKLSNIDGTWKDSTTSRVHLPADA